MYTTTQIDELIQHYLSKGGEVFQIEEGTLGHGYLVLWAPGCKFATVKEKYLNEWSSAHTVRLSHKIGAKAAKIVGFNEV